MNKDDFFYCDMTSNEKWIEIWMEENLKGFVHRNNILLVENLETEKQKELITQILNRQKQLGNELQEYYNNCVKSHPFRSEELEKFEVHGKETEHYSATKYNPVLDFLPIYFCSTKDTAIIQLFLMTMLANWGSADELPSFTIGRCYACHSDLVINQIKNLKNGKDKEFIFNKIEWGLENNFYNNENTEYNSLKTKLDEERENNR